LDDKNTDHEVTWETVDGLVAQGRILKPNNKEPFTDPAEILGPDPASRSAAEHDVVLIEKLAMRKPPQGKYRGEIIVRSGKQEEMLPRFISRHLPWGAAGLILAALLAASMSSIDSGLNSICTLVVMDLHRRYGWGKAWLAGKLGKQPDQLDEADELRLAQPLTLAIGLAATAFSLAVAIFADRDIFTIMVEVANTFGAPLLAVFLLGMLTRRTTSTAALIAMIVGSVFTIGLTTVNKLVAYDLLPKEWGYAGIWNVVFGTAFTLVVGYALSFVLGRPKSKTELRGLVAGCGTLGVRAIDEEVTIVSGPPPAGGGKRWKGNKTERRKE
jgi:hypothetical protein